MRGRCVWLLCGGLVNPCLQGASLTPATQCDWSHGSGSVWQIIPQFYTTLSVPPGQSMEQNPQYEPVLRCWRNQRDRNRTCQCLSPRGDEVKGWWRFSGAGSQYWGKSSIYPAVSPLSDLNQSKFQRKRQWEAVELSCGMWHNANVWNKVLIQANSGLPATFRGLLTYVRRDDALGTPPPTPDANMCTCKHSHESIEIWLKTNSVDPRPRMPAG